MDAKEANADHSDQSAKPQVLHQGPHTPAQRPKLAENLEDVRCNDSVELRRSPVQIDQTTANQVRWPE